MDTRRAWMLVAALICSGALVVGSAVADLPPNSEKQGKDPSSANAAAVPESASETELTSNDIAVKMVFSNSGELVPWTKPQPATGHPYGSKGVGFDGSPGTGAPPATLGGFPMTAFPVNPSPLGTVVTTVAVPNPPCDGVITFDPAMQLQQIGSGWNTWSHGYTGQVYVPEAYAEITTLLITMPANTCAFYLYVEPNNYEAHDITCIANEGLADEVSSGPVSVVGNAGATYFGFFSDADSHIVTVRVNAVATAQGFAVGEFGICCGETCVVEPVACCFDALATCYDSYGLVDCMNEGGRYELGVEYCADLTPLCGAAIGACCCNAGGDPDVPCEAYECIGDMTGPECLALGEETNWTAGESCDAVPPYDCGAPTYCDASGGCDEYISGVELGDISNLGTGCSGYADYTGISTYLLYGVDYDITVTNGLYYSTDITTVWIDWNQDKDFADAGEMVTSGDPGGAIYTDTISVEAGALAGPTRMRIRMQYGGTPDPCGPMTYGEVEDYTVIIGEPPPYGACCVGAVCYWDDDPPMDQAACDALGGVYQGDGTDCDPNPCVGACCDPITGDCTLTTEGDCTGDYQGDGTDCDPNPCPQPPPDCPALSMVAQPPHLPSDAWTFGVSNVGFPYIRYENYTGCLGDVTEIIWWGGELTASFVNCDRSPNDFQINFYADDGTGLHPDVGSGAICSYTIADGTFTREFTGFRYHNTYQVMLWEYHAVLPTPCAVPTDGWFSLQGVNDEASDCRFWWVSSPDGDAYHCGGASAPDTCGGDNNFDFAFCFIGEYVPRYGACCDPATGICTDGVEIINCLPPLQFAQDQSCADAFPNCGNRGACCDDNTGICTDDVLALDCPGRHAPGVTCASEPFDPPCGELTCMGMLYAPSNPDNPTFRAAVAAITGQPCDFWDTSASTPTLADLQDYCCVFTWGNYPYADAVGFGNTLAAFVDGGGKVILGQWTLHSDQSNWLDGMIMTPAYCPVTAASTSFSSGTYAGDGIDCVHTLGPVTSYANASYCDQITGLSPGAFSDGTFTETGNPSTIRRADRRVYYSPGNTGASTGEAMADWPLLTANMCRCASEPTFGSCCDPTTGICADGVEIMCCPMAHDWSPESCAERVPPCGNAGACCDPFTGDCEDDVFEVNCPADFRFEPGEQCAELNPECGTPGCCCYPEDGVTPLAPFESLEANCEGRFLPGVVGGDCVGTAFDPECGLYQCSGFLYAPAWDDNATFRAGISAVTGQPCDYWDARTATPTLEDLADYCCVMTWVNNAYLDNVAMGNVLAEFVDQGGKVILGQWTLHSDQSVWLDGAIMTPAYCPVTAMSTSYNDGTYAGDGTDCVHVLGGVSAYDADYLDTISVLSPGALTDGTFTETGSAAVAWRADRKVYYSPGNTGTDYTLTGPGDWVQLTANMCLCTDEELIGACCDEVGQVCYEEYSAADCGLIDGSRFILGGVCADFDPPCGQVVGACCYGTTCVVERPSECTGVYKGDGTDCDPNPCLEFWMDNEPVTTCGGTFYDSGGPTAPYSDNEAYTKTFTPDTAGMMLQFEFTAWAVEGSTYDNLWIYDGPTTADPLIGQFGTGSPGTVAANNATGQLTFYFQTDGSVTYDGWEATISCVPPAVAACCVGADCTMTTFVDCDALGGTWYPDEDCATFECPIGGCDHTVTLWDDYGDGWNGGTLDVLVNGVIVLDDITLADGYGPESHTFNADTGDAITTVYVAGGWGYENSYCLYDGAGTELGCDGLGGVEPTAGIAVTGLCPTCDHTVTLWDDYGDGWNGGTLDVLVNGVIVLDDLTIADGFGPESHTFTVATGDAITTAYVVGGWGYENSYCIYDMVGTELGCDGVGGVEPAAGGIAVTADCSGVAPTGACCVDGACTDDVEESACAEFWFVGQTCLDVEPCPVRPENDDCEDATPVVAPYPVTVYGDNTYADIDCPGVLNWNATWWEIELPYASNDLTIDFCPTLHGGQPYLTNGIVVYVDCTDCSAYDIADTYNYDSYCPEQNITMSWAALAGPGTILFPAYMKAGADAASAVLIPYGLNIDVTEAVPPQPSPKGGKVMTQGIGIYRDSTTATNQPPVDKKRIRAGLGDLGGIDSQVPARSGG